MRLVNKGFLPIEDIELNSGRTSVTHHAIKIVEKSVLHGVSPVGVQGLEINANSSSSGQMGFRKMVTKAATIRVGNNVAVPVARVVVDAQIVSYVVEVTRET